MDSRCIVILSLPRSGSSCVAGCLHRLGVDMGEGHLQPADKNNPRGYYEDLRWQKVNKRLAGNAYSTSRVWTLPDKQRARYAELAAKCAKSPLWGLKGPRMAFTFQHIWPIVAEVAEVRVVWVLRERDSVIASLVQHSRVAYSGSRAMDQTQAGRLLNKWNSTLRGALETFRGPALEVYYDDLMDNPPLTLGSLAAFALPARRDRTSWMSEYQDALAFVDDGLRHHGGAV